MGKQTERKRLRMDLDHADAALREMFGPDRAARIMDRIRAATSRESTDRLREALDDARALAEATADHAQAAVEDRHEDVNWHAVATSAVRIADKARKALDHYEEERITPNEEWEDVPLRMAEGKRTVVDGETLDRLRSSDDEQAALADPDELRDLAGTSGAVSTGLGEPLGAAASEIERLQWHVDRLRGRTVLRRLLWLRHGCDVGALYGDDGEMQCNACGIDFKRDDPEQIEAVFREQARDALARGEDAEECRCKQVEPITDANPVAEIDDSDCPVHGPPTRERMAEHVEDIGQRLMEGDLDPEKAGGSLQYLAERLRRFRPDVQAEALHREAKRDVSRQQDRIEALESVRLTCHGGHTSTLRELREEADCSAPCCPRCGECSFTFEPSDALDRHDDLPAINPAWTRAAGNSPDDGPEDENRLWVVLPDERPRFYVEATDTEGAIQIVAAIAGQSIQYRVHPVPDAGPVASLIKGIRTGCRTAYRVADDAGWHTGRPWPTLIALMHSELSEALEALREDGPSTPSDKIDGFTGLEEELADVLIRIFDAAAQHDLALAEAVAAKLRYNAGREHRHGGKAF